MNQCKTPDHPPSHRSAQETFALTRTRLRQVLTIELEVSKQELGNEIPTVATVGTIFGISVRDERMDSWGEMERKAMASLLQARQQVFENIKW